MSKFNYLTTDPTERPVYTPQIDPIEDPNGFNELIRFIRDHIDNVYEIENELAGWLDVTRSHYFAKGYQEAIEDMTDRITEMKKIIVTVDV